MNDLYKREMSVLAWTGAIVTLVVQSTILAGTVLLTVFAAAETLEPFFESGSRFKVYLLVGCVFACRAMILAQPVAVAKWRTASVQHRDPVRKWFRLACEASFLTWAGCMIIIFSGLFWPVSLLLVRRLRKVRRSRLIEEDERDVEELTIAMREDVG